MGRVLGTALAAEFGSPVRAADEARFLVRRVDLQGSIGIYVPPRREASRPGLVLGSTTHGREREAMFAIAVAHHYLNHRTIDAYVYTKTGARFQLPLEEAAAREFAVAFLRAMPIAPVVKRYARG